ncbi:carboxypeptidase-like regulatory domain-containing protein [Lacinutrix neustonica]|uniref:Carboxypeptidase-like regulatory domain-containing protein n=1 Tax=Lacinutrix neustonica TaxID=2980107 RepID=A0A9E8MXS4_9FLAO|nr:carboxypeptidase-like regulatory domain-containing protein [Lacinutrix neustonica]WAC03326.1 carboxypeptidase-like regulatory domain-containing protein [Lacinutrix neustonica]
MFKIKNAKGILFLLFSFCGVVAFAQIKLNNKVAEFGFETPIENASVYIQSTAIGTVTNTDGNFSLRVPQENLRDTLVVSSIGYATFKIAIPEYDAKEVIFLEQQVASLEEVMIESEPGPKTGNDIVLKALKELPKQCRFFLFAKRFSTT